MNKTFAVLVSGITLLLTSCSSNIQEGTNSVATDTTSASVATDTTSRPVETAAPNSNYKPAFKGQTRIAGVKTSTPFEGKVLTDQLKKPWGITSLPDGRLLITEKEGTMRIATLTGNLEFTHYRPSSGEFQRAGRFIRTYY